MYCNWGILGPGFIATRAIIPAVQEASNSRILAVASSYEQRASEVASRFEIERFYSDYQSLLVDPDIDVVYIALPNH
ncbi:MAG TPA: Gfo/Idh/MocA family oxidoreductase, partial [Ktedonobacteraceae bacterium]|nr:Gfo/Idh/MocA family oxidoreductase [Ktedonobacteraceae bacterium]